MSFTTKEWSCAIKTGPPLWKITGGFILGDSGQWSTQWSWKIVIGSAHLVRWSRMLYLLRMLIFYSHVNLPEGTPTHPGSLNEKWEMISTRWICIWLRHDMFSEARKPTQTAFAKGRNLCTSCWVPLAMRQSATLVQDKIAGLATCSMSVERTISSSCGTRCPQPDLTVKLQRAIGNLGLSSWGRWGLVHDWVLQSGIVHLRTIWALLNMQKRSCNYYSPQVIHHMLGVSSDWFPYFALEFSRVYSVFRQ